ncbi:MAG TPA: hypothetical protein VFU31_15320 [Candidatus Binatia bacterium]|nr:hypothetical protein [Candidatus Binatia bacterium]
MNNLRQAATNAASAPKNEHPSYAKELRALGQALESRHIVALDLVAVADVYAIRAKTRLPQDAHGSGTLSLKSTLGKVWSALSGDSRRSRVQTVDFRYSVEEIMQLDRAGRSMRSDPAGTPNPNALSQILRSAGSYLDFKERSSLIGISIQERSVTIRYQTADGQPQEAKQDMEYFYDYWVKMYLRRSNRPVISTPADPVFFAVWEQLQKLYALPDRR